MESWRALFCLSFLCFLMHARGQRDFDLADALDDPEPTKKPSSDIHPKPKPPYRPQPGIPDSGGNIDPRPKPPPRPYPGSSDNSGGFFNDVDRDDGRYPPRPRPPAGGGGGHHPGYGGYGNTYGGNGYSTYGNQHGNTVAKIVSPIVSVVVVALVGAAARYFQRNRTRNCFRTNAELQFPASFVGQYGHVTALANGVPPPF
ncbi:PREDICTED: glycoprotein Xg [Ceratotherium simum simum]|uniref:Glycoprotein Xg n=1 Tax=Ceratotherium simum simum TaxID=73337 RepID=A0ABM0I5J7_CERSS|nr:PREDICTED: glycoprotein Xg [Ceratotherium simum simum]